MKASVSSESILINNKEYTLVGVSASPNSFGLCDTTLQKDKGVRESFYVGNEPLLNITQRSINDLYSNKIISQVSTIDRCGDFSKKVITAVGDYYYDNKNLVSALMPLLEYVKSGLYIVYESNMIPTDGEGNFFWSSYMVGHEFGGSSTFNSIYKKERSLTPCFLAPTENFGSFTDKLMKLAMEKVKKDKCAYGLCFHLSGMFCALLSNHYDATAALLQDKKIKCIVIEPIRYICTEEEMRSYILAHKHPEESESEEANQNGQENNAENTENSNTATDTEDDLEAAIEPCLYSCGVKIPFSKVPNSLLERFFVTRKSTFNKYSDTVSFNCERVSHAKSKRSIPANVLEKCEKYPDYEMLQSAALVNHLTDEELNALLLGETMLDGKYIINKNYYSSITIALNYLQYKDFNRFISFVSSLLKNEELTAVHQYAASRLQSIMDPRIDSIFKEILSSENTAYNTLKSCANKYVKRYSAYREAAAAREMEQAKRNSSQAHVLKRDISNELNSLQAIVKTR